MQAAALLLHWGSYHWARNLWVLIIYFFFLPVMLPSASKARHRLGSASVSWCLETSLFFKTPFLGGISISTSFVSLFIFYSFSYLLLKTMGCFSGCLMSSASIQKLFCGIYSALKCSLDEFVGEKVVSLSYSSAILGLPSLHTIFNLLANSVLSFQLSFSCISFFSHYVKKQFHIHLIAASIICCIKHF